MSETAPETPDEVVETAPSEPPATGEDDLGDAGKKALDAERARAKEAEKRAKQLERELAQVRTANLSDAEKAVAEAEQRGAQKAAEQWSQRLVRADFVAAASKRNPDFDAASVLDDLNLSRFVGDDGEPDAAAIAAAVERLIPSGTRRPRGDADQGPRDPSADVPADKLADAVLARRGF